VEAGRYYQQSRDVYQQIGDERRAAEQEVNAAALLVAGNADEAFRRLANARATFHARGYVDFEVFAMQVQAESLAKMGRLDEALRLLREAASIATERQLKDRLAEVKMWVGNVQILQGDYEAARKILEEVLAGDSAPAQAQISLGRAYLGLGNLAQAKTHLDSGLARVRKSGESDLIALAEQAIAELTARSHENTSRR
jgi:tetratricopeptide (TPR) repeat protein